MSNHRIDVLHRAMMLLAAIWFIGFFVAQREVIGFSWMVAWSTPSTLCSDAFSRDDQRLFDCLRAGGASYSDLVKVESGTTIKVPFDPYQREHHKPTVWLWWLGVPLVLWLVKPALNWVLTGTVGPEDRRRS